MAQQWPPGTEPEIPEADLGIMEIHGAEAARDWADRFPGMPDAPPAIDPGPLPGGPPVAAFTYTPPIPTKNITVTFDGSASAPGDPELVITNWAWLFDNKDTGSGMVVTWKLPNKAGTFPVTLTVTDSALQTGDSTQELTI